MTSQEITRDIKDCMFQCAVMGSIVEDTGLITRDEAKALRDKYLPRCVNALRDNKAFDMCIWGYCDSNTDYSHELYRIDDDCVIQNGKIKRKIVMYETVCDMPTP